MFFQYTPRVEWRSRRRRRRTAQQQRLQMYHMRRNENLHMGKITSYRIVNSFLFVSLPMCWRALRLARDFCMEFEWCTCAITATFTFAGNFTRCHLHGFFFVWPAKVCWEWESSAEQHLITRVCEFRTNKYFNSRRRWANVGGCQWRGKSYTFSVIEIFFFVLFFLLQSEFTIICFERFGIGEFYWFDECRPCSSATWTSNNWEIIITNAFAVTRHLFLDLVQRIFANVDNRCHMKTECNFNFFAIVICVQQMIE